MNISNNSIQNNQPVFGKNVTKVAKEFTEKLPEFNRSKINKKDHFLKAAKHASKCEAPREYTVICSPKKIANSIVENIKSFFKNIATV